MADIVMACIVMAYVAVATCPRTGDRQRVDQDDGNDREHSGTPARVHVGHNYTA